MNIFKKIVYFFLRVSMGWLFFYAGITKILDAKWSAKQYIAQAKILPELYNWFLSPTILPTIDFLNKWGLTLIGASLIIGFLVRFSSPFGALLMMLYYFPILNFPYVGSGKVSYIVDQHIIFTLVFIMFILIDAGKYWGLDYYRSKNKF